MLHFFILSYFHLCKYLNLINSIPQSNLRVKVKQMNFVQFYLCVYYYKFYLLFFVKEVSWFWLVLKYVFFKILVRKCTALFLFSLRIRICFKKVTQNTIATGTKFMLHLSAILPEEPQIRNGSSLNGKWQVPLSIKSSRCTLFNIQGFIVS